MHRPDAADESTLLEDDNLMPPGEERLAATIPRSPPPMTTTSLSLGRAFALVPGARVRRSKPVPASMVRETRAATAEASEPSPAYTPCGREPAALSALAAIDAGPQRKTVDGRRDAA